MEDNYFEQYSFNKLEHTKKKQEKYGKTTISRELLSQDFNNNTYKLWRNISFDGKSSTIV